MKSYNEFPPFNNFLKILNHLPKSALLFATIWCLKKKNHLSIRRRDVQKKLSVSQTVFRNQLIFLQKLDQLSFEENIDTFEINFFETKDA